MQQLLEIIALLFLMFLILRVSLARGGRGFGLRGGLTLLNITTGALVGIAAAIMIRGIGGAAALPGGGLEESGYAVLVAAMRRVLPLIGAVLGGIAGYLLFGSIWQKLERDRSGGRTLWLRRAQITVVAAALAFLLGRWLT